MADGYTEADLRLVEEALPYDPDPARKRIQARLIVEHLAGAGRLLPEDPGLAEYDLSDLPDEIYAEACRLHDIVHKPGGLYDKARNTAGCDRFWCLRTVPELLHSVEPRIRADERARAGLLPEDTRAEYAVRWHGRDVVASREYYREQVIATAAQFPFAEAVERRVGPWVPVPGAPVERERDDRDALIAMQSWDAAERAEEAEGAEVPVPTEPPLVCGCGVAPDGAPGAAGCSPSCMTPEPAGLSEEKP